ncbi:RNA polymerase sigma factor [Sorangium sp. So ce388]|uniref:RNA polymerase sigma factor n=1 Tax=Sorangium sp. So ce388 TaxID=3133309 RepID=UPI003F5B74A6
MEPSHAFMAAITDEHFSFIARYLARLGVRAQDIEDVAQEVLAGAYRALPRFDPSRGSVRSWLMGIATHQASNHFRRAHRRRERLRPLDDLAALPDGTPDSEQRVIARDRRSVLDKLLEEMPMERRCVFIAHEIEEIDMAEIAEQLSIPLSTAWSRHRLAWVDIEAAMRRWQARQRGRGLALIPFGAGALVEEARADRGLGRTLLARLYRGARGVLSRWRLALTGGATSRSGVAGALHAVTVVAVPLAGAAVAFAIALGALAAALPRTPAGQRAAPPLALVAVEPPPQSTAPATMAPPPESLAPPPSAGATPPPSAPSAAAVPRDVGAASAGAGIAGAGIARSAALPGRSTPRPAAAASPRAAVRAVASRDQEIAAERALIDSAITALSSGRRAEASSLLIEHRRRFPTGRLTAERDAALRALRSRPFTIPPPPPL